MSIKTVFRYDGRDAYRIDIPSRGSDAKRIILTAGVHGNESVGVATLLELLPELVYNSRIRENYDIVIYPNMNPGGLAKNTRRLLNGIDYNRSFATGAEESITEKFARSLDGESFDISLDLHEAWSRDGFFIIPAEDQPSKNLKALLSQMDPNDLLTSPNGVYPYPIFSTFQPARLVYVLESPGVARSTNKGTLKSFFANSLGVERSYTLESTPQVELTRRIEVYKRLVLSFLN